METTANTTPVATVVAMGRKRIIAGLPFDWTFTAATGWLLGGLYLDGWAHFHIPSLETFLTPWHAVFYSGFAAVVACLLVALFANHARGIGWTRALPAGYGASILGAGLFAAAGVADLTWHTLLGIERSTEALFSPPHLLLATGGIMMAAGPMRAAWLRKNTKPVWSALGPSLLAMTFIMSVLGFFTVYVNPLAYIWVANGSYGVGGFSQLSQMNFGIGVAGIILHSATFMGLLMLALRTWRLPFGAITVLLVASALLISVLRDTYRLIPLVLLAALIAELLQKMLRPDTSTSWGLRVFAFAVPAFYYLIYFLGIQLVAGIAWTFPVWTGTVFIAGMTGLLLSYLMTPPAAINSFDRPIM